jgi:ABC-type uncharacterized transport system permease subunit
MIIVGPYQMVWRLLCRFCFIKRLITVQPFVQYSVLWYEFGHLQLSNESNEEDWTILANCLHVQCHSIRYLQYFQVSQSGTFNIFSIFSTFFNNLLISIFSAKG